MRCMWSKLPIKALGDHSIGTYIEFFEKRSCARQGVIKVKFAENFPYVLNK